MHVCVTRKPLQQGVTLPFPPHHSLLTTTHPVGHIHDTLLCQKFQNPAVGGAAVDILHFEQHGILDVEGSYVCVCEEKKQMA